MTEAALAESPVSRPAAARRNTIEFCPNPASPPPSQLLAHTGQWIVLSWPLILPSRKWPAVSHADQPRAPRILVVDDEEAIRSFAERVLRDASYQVTVAPGGLEALKIAQEQGPFDLFVLDVVMPRMTGDEVAATIRRADPDAKILYFTGFSDRLFTARSTLWENEAFVEKPATMKGLLEAVSMSLFGHTHGPKPTPGAS
jgi:CheY-like chemotaxis protein